MAGVGHVAWRHWFPRRVWRLVTRVEAADEVPQRLPLNGVALVGTQRKPKWLVFDCPCRQQHRVMLNLESSRRPCWRFSTKNGLTVSPSVDYRGNDYRCHYFVKRGRIIWIQDEDDD